MNYHRPKKNRKNIINKWRIYRKLSQKEVADKLNMSLTLYCNLENNKISLHYREELKLLYIFDIIDPKDEITEKHINRLYED